jgi:hypothetical protein
MSRVTEVASGSVEERLESQEAKVAALDAEVSTLKKELHRVTSELADRKRQIDSLMSMGADFQTDLGRLKKQLAELKADSGKSGPAPSSSSPEPKGKKKAEAPAVPEEEPELIEHLPYTGSTTTQLNFDQSAPLKGIIDYLTGKHGGNVDETGVVKVNGIPLKRDPKFMPKNAAQLESDSWYFSANAPNQYLRYDFRKLRIRPTHYTIRSKYNGSVGSAHLKSWVIEQSVDGTTWIEVDRRQNNSELNGPNRIATFEIAHPEECRMVRLRQTGPAHDGNNSIVICAFELFGTLLE